RLRLADTVQPDQLRHPLETGHPLVEGVLFRTEPDARVEGGIVPDRRPEDAHRPFARFELTGDQLHERRLAGAFRPEQTGEAGRHRHRHVVQADHLAVPLRQMVGGDDAGCRHATTSMPRTRRSRMKPDTAIRPTIINSATGHGVSYFDGIRKITSPSCERFAGNEIHDSCVLRVTTVSTP